MGRGRRSRLAACWACHPLTSVGRLVQHEDRPSLENVDGVEKRPLCHRRLLGNEIELRDLPTQLARQQRLQQLVGSVVQPADATEKRAVVGETDVGRRVQQFLHALVDGA